MRDAFLEYSVETLTQYSARIQDCLDRLTDDKIWMRDSDNVNAAGNLVLHLCGNVRQWIGTGVAGLPAIRQRDAEFAARGGVPKAELSARLTQTMQEAAAIVGALTSERLAERISVQGYDVTVLEAVYHVVEHFSHHAGQIVFATKLLTGEDLGYYKHLSPQKATFGAGCFWGVEAEFRQTPGVTSTTVGYMGGSLKNPTYRDVCGKTTGHAEVVQVEYDPSKVAYDQLLDVFWENHDPTTLNRQGPDVGSQYRSAIFFHTPEQETAAKASRAMLAASGKHAKPVVTEITAAPEFWRAEEYHQQYLEKRGRAHCGI